ncbi:hypothetical protein C5F46_15715 [Phaeovulum veldkampii DSM 11550]|uniref:Uncharacterized protein n=2 Tax=Phaeovulum veldkampii TaxID=33049 RepID=A0A2T4J643_9RHOB|nr:hypothetical protein C5F46_15715 [Phaeovulum veldkampii DSM 11550]
MAKSSDKFSERLRMAWVNYLYKIHWSELEAMLMKEDLPLFRKLKKRLRDDLAKDVEQKKKWLFEQTANAPRPLSDEQASNYANAETIIMAMNGKRASHTVSVIVDFYSAICQTVDYQREFSKGRQNQS